MNYEFEYSEAVLRAILDSLFTEITDLRLASMRTDVVAGLNRLPYSERLSLVYDAAGYSEAAIGKKLGVSRSSARRLVEKAFIRLLVYLNLGVDNSVRLLSSETDGNFERDLMDWNEYQQWVATKARKGGPKLNMTNAALGLTGEAGEVADIVKKHVFHKHPMTDEMRLAVAKELGDILFYLTWTAGLFHWHLSSIAEMNVSKLNARYPDGFDTEKSIHRQEGDK